MLNSQFNRRVLIDLFIWNDDQNSSRHVIYVCSTLGEWRVENRVSRVLVPNSGPFEAEQGDGPGWWLGKSLSSMHVSPAHCLVCNVNCAEQRGWPCA